MSLYDIYPPEINCVCRPPMPRGLTGKVITYGSSQYAECGVCGGYRYQQETPIKVNYGAGVTIPAPVVSAPSYSFVSSIFNGIYRDENGSLRVVVDGKDQPMDQVPPLSTAKVPDPVQAASDVVEKEVLRPRRIHLNEEKK